MFIEYEVGMEFLWKSCEGELVGRVCKYRILGGRDKGYGESEEV